MATIANFTGSFGVQNGGFYQGDNVAGTIIAMLGDGPISVGDPVYLANFSTGTKWMGGVSDDTAFYLGKGTFGGKLGFVFGDLNTIAANNAFLVAFVETVSGPELFDVVDFMSTKHPLNSDPFCFAAGTLIATPSSETTVETLQIGDLIRTADGRDVRVKWVGRQTIVKPFAGAMAQLVRITAGTLGNHSDLFVTGDHGMVIPSSSKSVGENQNGGYIITASALVNGTTIDWVPLSDTPERQIVYHIETENHDVILANGAPSETYLDTPGRASFDNYREYLDLYGAEQMIAENPMRRISSARLVPDHLRRRLIA